MARFFNFTSVECVRIGTGAARITHVTNQKVTYIDERGRELFVDLNECQRIGSGLEIAGVFPPSDDVDWASVADGVYSSSDSAGQTAPAGGCVGLRGALDHPPWFQFLNRRRTQFEFKNRDALYAELLTPMGRTTFDAG